MLLLMRLANWIISLHVYIRAYIYYSYWTDNGACYYYDTGNYSNYEEVLDAVMADADRANIPFKYLQVHKTLVVIHALL